MYQWAPQIISMCADVLKQHPSKTAKFFSVVSLVLRYPIKAVAAFVFSPILAIRIVALSKKPIRKIIVGLGVIVAIIISMFSGKFLGSLVGAIFIGSKFGLLAGLGFALGTTFSVSMAMVFSLFIFNGTILMFLHLSSDEVIAYLKSISE